MAEKLIYIAYDDKRFDDLQEGFAYDMAALRSVANELWFVQTDLPYDGFNHIPCNHYENAIIGFNHTADIQKIIQFFVDCPIIYCATDRAAQVLTGVLKNPNRTISIEGLAKGINYWFDGADRFYHEEHFIDNFDGTAFAQFCCLRDTIEIFIKNNGIAA